MTRNQHHDIIELDRKDFELESAEFGYGEFDEMQMRAETRAIQENMRRKQQRQGHRERW